MFTPNAKDRKLFLGLDPRTVYTGQAYIYRDGIAMDEKREIMLDDKTKHTIEVLHVWQVETPIYVCDVQRHYGDQEPLPEGELEIQCITVWEPSVLAHGLRSVSVEVGASTENAKSRGLHMIAVTLTDAEGIDNVRRSIRGVLLDDNQAKTKKEFWMNSIAQHIENAHCPVIQHTPEAK